jgi:hypothetical protein
LLIFKQVSQEHDLPVRKFQRIMIYIYIYTCYQNTLSRIIRSSETATVEVCAFADVAPIHDRRAELLIARVNRLGELVA